MPGVNFLGILIEYPSLCPSDWILHNADTSGRRQPYSFKIVTFFDEENEIMKVF